MAHFYYKFMVSEAGHYRLFMDIARKYFDATRVKKRWETYLSLESEVIKELSPRGDRVH